MGESVLEQFIATQPGMAIGMLREHVNDGTGHCRKCSVGHNAGHSIWPCDSYNIAKRIVDKQAGR